MNTQIGDPMASAYPISSQGMRKEIVEATKFDVLFGRGAGNYNHFGNLVYRRLVQSTTEEYAACLSPVDRDMLAMEVIREIHERGGRFLKRAATDRSQEAQLTMLAWEVVDIGTTIRKVKQLFRDYLCDRKSRKKAPAAASAEAEAEADSVLASSKKKRMEASQPQPTIQPQRLIMSQSYEKPHANRFQGDHNVQGDGSSTSSEDGLKSPPEGYDPEDEEEETMPPTKAPQVSRRPAANEGLFTSKRSFPAQKRTLSHETAELLEELDRWQSRRRALEQELLLRHRLQSGPDTNRDFRPRGSY